jgi:hypothetical protein
LDLLLYVAEYNRHGLSNALAERFWRVTQAAPDAPIDIRIALAVRLKVFATLNRRNDLAQCEHYLCSKGWSTGEPMPELKLTLNEFAAGDNLEAITAAAHVSAATVAEIERIRNSPKRT